MAPNKLNGKSLESWIWDAACSIRGAKDATKFLHHSLVMAKSSMSATAVPIFETATL